MLNLLHFKSIRFLELVKDEKNKDNLILFLTSIKMVAENMVECIDVNTDIISCHISIDRYTNMIKIEGINYGIIAKSINLGEFAYYGLALLSHDTKDNHDIWERIIDRVCSNISIYRTKKKFDYQRVEKQMISRINGLISMMDVGAL